MTHRLQIVAGPMPQLSTCFSCVPAGHGEILTEANQSTVSASPSSTATKRLLTIHHPPKLATIVDDGSPWKRTVFVLKKIAISLKVFALAGCAAAHPEHRWGYNINEPPYAVAASKVTAGGIRFDPSGQPISGALLDRLTNEVAACLGKPIDRASFIVKVPANWSLSCDGSQQVLLNAAGELGCDAKGLPRVEGCQCRWRALIQYPNVIVATPSLYLYKDALTRFVTGSQNPWIDPKLAPCASPTTLPLSNGEGP